MITLQLGEKTFEVQDFRFTHLKQAAPIMDRIAERTLAPPEGGFTVATVETGADMLEVLAIRIEGETRDSLLDQASFQDIGSIGERPKRRAQDPGAAGLRRPDRGRPGSHHGGAGELGGAAYRLGEDPKRHRRQAGHPVQAVPADPQG